MDDLASRHLTSSPPLVTIVTPSFNQSQFLEETILSVLEQDYTNIEYLIVDGGSTDRSVEIIKRYASESSKQVQGPHLAWWVSEKDQGQTDAINKGFKRAQGEILAWINSDDTYVPGAVSQAVAYLQSNPDVGMVYGDCDLIGEKGEFLGHFPARQTNYRRLRRGFVHIPQQSSFFRAHLWRQVGPLDPSFYFSMDYDLWVRLSKIAPIHYEQQLWANFRLHGSGKSVISDSRCWPEMLRVHYREGGSKLSPIYFKAKIRPLIYAWLPQKLRLWVRKIV